MIVIVMGVKSPVQSVFERAVIQNPFGYSFDVFFGRVGDFKGEWAVVGNRGKIWFMWG